MRGWSVDVRYHRSPSIKSNIYFKAFCFLCNDKNAYWMTEWQEILWYPKTLLFKNACQILINVETKDVFCSLKLPFKKKLYTVKIIGSELRNNQMTILFVGHSWIKRWIKFDLWTKIPTVKTTRRNSVISLTVL